ncbi:MAG: deoxyribose-phosphate aldolase [Saprospiraceae bacterium]|nr:deoxyribose-phosphate aldolase [Saprospiraceae bacterium]MDW8483349.1 deoxyribose-phosphate aldolase [Saprospiraceae bacterium]
MRPPFLSTVDLMLNLTEVIEHTLLKPDCTPDEIRRLCKEAVKYGFWGVCVPPYYVRDAKRFLEKDLLQVRVCTVIGFPMGYSATVAKSEEIKRAFDDGADEIDAVLNIAAVKSKQWNHVERDVDAIATATRLRNGISKLILECALLTDEEIRQVVEIARRTGIHFLKTSTGFLGYPATEAMVQQLKQLANGELKIKAAGGIRTRAQAEALLRAGADRLGTSASVEIVKG